MRGAVAVAFAGVMAIGTASAGERVLTVCLGPSFQVGYSVQTRAQGYATRVYRTIGVDLRWNDACAAAEREAPGAHSAPNLGVIAMEWKPLAPAHVAPGVLAWSRPYQPTGTRVTIFVDRVKAAGAADPSRAAALLGHVFAHEIGHVLLGHNGHTPEGLMKASWSIDDQDDMLHHLVSFTRLDADAIRAALDRRPPPSIRRDGYAALSNPSD